MKTNKWSIEYQNDMDMDTPRGLSHVPALALYAILCPMALVLHYCNSKKKKKKLVASWALSETETNRYKNLVPIEFRYTATPCPYIQTSINEISLHNLPCTGKDFYMAGILSRMHINELSSEEIEKLQEIIATLPPGSDH